MVLEGSGVAVFLDDKKRYPTLLRFSYTQMKASQLVVQFMKLNKWRNLVVVYNAEEAVFRVDDDGQRIVGHRHFDVIDTGDLAVCHFLGGNRPRSIGAGRPPRAAASLHQR